MWLRLLVLFVWERVLVSNSCRKSLPKIAFSVTFSRLIFCWRRKWGAVWADQENQRRLIEKPELIEERGCASSFPEFYAPHEAFSWWELRDGVCIYGAVLPGPSPISYLSSASLLRVYYAYERILYDGGTRNRLPWESSGAFRVLWVGSQLDPKKGLADMDGDVDELWAVRCWNQFLFIHFILSLSFFLFVDACRGWHSHSYHFPKSCEITVCFFHCVWWGSFIHPIQWGNRGRTK